MVLARFFGDRGYACAVINSGMEMNLAGGKYYRYLKSDEESAPLDFGYVYNLMFVREGSGLYPSPVLYGKPFHGFPYSVLQISSAQERRQPFVEPVLSR